MLLVEAATAALSAYATVAGTPAADVLAATALAPAPARHSRY